MVSAAKILFEGSRNKRDFTSFFNTLRSSKGAIRFESRVYEHALRGWKPLPRIYKTV